MFSSNEKQCKISFMDLLFKTMQIPTNSYVIYFASTIIQVCGYRYNQ